MSGNGRRSGLIKGRGRHRDPKANIIWYPRMPVSSTGVPMYVTAAAGVVVAGMITTVAPSTTAETTLTDLVSSPESTPQDAVLAALAPTSEPTVTAWPEASMANVQGPAGSDGRGFRATEGTAPDRSEPRRYVLPTPAGVLRAGSAVRQMGRGVGSVFAIEGRPQWLAHPVAPFPPRPRLPDDVAVGAVYVAMPVGVADAVQSGLIPPPQIERGDMGQVVTVPPLRDPVAVVDTTGWVPQAPLAPITASISTGSGVAAEALVVVPATVVEPAPVTAVLPESMLPDPPEPHPSQVPSQEGLVVAQEPLPDAAGLTTEAFAPRSTPLGVPETDADYQPPVLGEFIPEQPVLGEFIPEQPVASPQVDIGGREGGQSTSPEQAPTPSTTASEDRVTAPTVDSDSGATQITPGESEAAVSDGPEPPDTSTDPVVTPDAAGFAGTAPDFTEPVWTSTVPWPTQMQTWPWDFQEGSSDADVTESVPGATQNEITEDSPSRPPAE